MSICNLPPLSKEQKPIVQSLLNNVKNEQVQTLGGLAGTGKTVCVAALYEKLRSFAPCAFTGKAAHALRRKGVAEASTIHSLIYHPPTPGGGFDFKLRSRHEIGCDGFLVDEASMINKELHRDILSLGLPCIFVGDHGQLEPVGSDVYLMKDPDYRLETIHRNAGPIARFAEHLRKGGLPRSFPPCDAVRVVSAADLTDKMLLSASQVICAWNKTRVGINRTIRKLWNRHGLLVSGDKIICLRNSRDAGLFNGMTGRVLAVDLEENVMNFKSDGVIHENVSFDPEVFGVAKPKLNYFPWTPHPFDYGYAVTCHKAQGSEWKRVLVFDQMCWGCDHRRWAYTAASRAKRSLVWVTA